MSGDMRAYGRQRMVGEVGEVGGVLLRLEEEAPFW